MAPQSTNRFRTPIMKWSDYKKNIKVLDQTEIEQLELISILVARRKEKGISQRDLAKMTGLHQAAIARFELERSVPRVDTLKKVAHALGLKLTLVEDQAAAAELTAL